MITRDLDMEELDRQLEQFRLDEAEREKPRKPVLDEDDGPRIWNPFNEDPSDEDPETSEMQQIQLTKLEAVRDKLQKMLDSERADYEAVDKLREKEGKTIVSEWICTAGFLSALFVILFLLKAPQIIVPWFILFLVLCCFTVRQVLLMLRRTANHQIMCIADPASAFVEEKKANTYLKQQLHAHHRMGEIKSRMDELDRWEKTLRKNGLLTEEELEKMQSVVHINNHPSVYVNEKFNLGEWAEYIFKK